jgi:hypothetical protein
LQGHQCGRAIGLLKVLQTRSSFHC